MQGTRSTERALDSHGGDAPTRKALFVSGANLPKELVSGEIVNRELGHESIEGNVRRQPPGVEKPHSVN